jgi:hypothetical protein
MEAHIALKAIEKKNPELIHFIHAIALDRFTDYIEANNHYDAIRDDDAFNIAVACFTKGASNESFTNNDPFEHDDDPDNPDS